MEKFTKFNEPKEVDFYEIFLNGKGEKMIHIIGYTGKGDNWYFIDADCDSEPLSEFINNMKDEDHVGLLYEVCKQYQTNCDTDEKILDAINTFFDGKPADYILKFDEITMDTPCGRFIHISL